MSNITLSPKTTHKFVDLRDKLVGDGFKWSWERPSTDVRYVVMHHTAGPDNQTCANIANYHVNSRGWGGIGYHFVIYRDGTINYVGDLGTARANVKDMNEKVTGVCLVGDFTKKLPSDEQITSAHELCKFLLFDLKAQFPNLDGWNSLVGHQDLSPTACPGSSWNGQGGMRDRIVNNIPYTPSTDPVEPPPPPPPVEPPTSDLEERVKKLEESEKQQSLAIGDLIVDITEVEDLLKSFANDIKDTYGAT